MNPLSHIVCFRCNRQGHHADECYRLRTGMRRITKGRNNSDSKLMDTSPELRNKKCPYLNPAVPTDKKPAAHLSDKTTQVPKVTSETLCGNCNKQGHAKTNCPTKCQCNICDEDTHFTEDCPKYVAPTPVIKCVRCKRFGHSGSECPYKRPMMLDNYTCGFCNQKGHLVVDCQNATSLPPCRSSSNSKLYNPPKTSTVSSKLTKSLKQDELVTQIQTDNDSIKFDKKLKQQPTITLLKQVLLKQMMSKAKSIVLNKLHETVPMDTSANMKGKSYSRPAGQPVEEQKDKRDNEPTDTFAKMKHRSSSSHKGISGKEQKNKPDIIILKRDNQILKDKSVVQIIEQPKEFAMKTSFKLKMASSSTQSKPVKEADGKHAIRILKRGNEITKDTPTSQATHLLKHVEKSLPKARHTNPDKPISPPGSSLHVYSVLPPMQSSTAMSHYTLPKDIVCYECREIGHFARYCPLKEMFRCICRTCRNPGHFARNCPKIYLSGDTKPICFFCREYGHIARNCPNK